MRVFSISDRVEYVWDAVEDPAASVPVRMLHRHLVEAVFASVVELLSYWSSTRQAMGVLSTSMVELKQQR